MEDVLDLYQPEYNPERPVVCFDETSRQLTGEVRPPIEAAPGRVARYDTEYQRNGTRNLLSRVNYICRLASISFAGSPPWPGRVAGQRWSGSWGRQTPG